MRMSPGDIIFSLRDTRIMAIGIAQSYCWESPKPVEFDMNNPRTTPPADLVAYIYLPVADD